MPTWGSALPGWELNYLHHGSRVNVEAFEEDIDRDEGAIVLSDEIAGVNIVHADACGYVNEDEVIMLCHRELPLLEFQFRHEFCLRGMGSFDVGLHGPNDAIAPKIAGDANKSHSRTWHLAGELGHPPQVGKGRGEAKAVGILNGAADDNFTFFSHHDPGIVL